MDDIQLDDLRENKNLKIATKKVSDKYKKVRRKCKAETSVPNLHKTSKTIAPIDNKKVKKQRDKATIIAAKKNIKKI